MTVVCAGALIFGCARSPPPTSIHLARAFADLCAPLETNAIAARAAEYAYVPSPSRRFASVPVEGSRNRPLTWMRDDGLFRTTLRWDEAASRCELAIGGVEPSVVESAFDLLVASWATQGWQATTVTPSTSRGTGGPHPSAALRTGSGACPATLHGGTVRSVQAALSVQMSGGGARQARDDAMATD